MSTLNWNYAHPPVSRTPSRGVSPVVPTPTSTSGSGWLSTSNTIVMSATSTTSDNTSVCSGSRVQQQPQDQPRGTCLQHQPFYTPGHEFAQHAPVQAQAQAYANMNASNQLNYQAWHSHIFGQTPHAHTYGQGAYLHSNPHPSPYPYPPPGLGPPKAQVQQQQQVLQFLQYQQYQQQQLQQYQQFQNLQQQQKASYQDPQQHQQCLQLHEHWRQTEAMPQFQKQPPQKANASAQDPSSPSVGPPPGPPQLHGGVPLIPGYPYGPFGIPYGAYTSQFPYPGYPYLHILQHQHLQQQLQQQQQQEEAPQSTQQHQSGQGANSNANQREWPALASASPSRPSVSAWMKGPPPLQIPSSQASQGREYGGQAPSAQTKGHARTPSESVYHTSPPPLGSPPMPSAPAPPYGYPMMPPPPSLGLTVNPSLGFESASTNGPGYRQPLPVHFSPTSNANPASAKPNASVSSHPPKTPARGAPPQSLGIESSTSHASYGGNDATEIHDSWLGRVAPLPGQSSRGVLLPMRFEDEEKEKGGNVKERTETYELRKSYSVSEENENGKEGETPVETRKQRRKRLREEAQAQGSSSNTSTNGSTNKNKKEDLEMEFRFDKYADSFVPQYLKNIQMNVHPLKPLPALPVFPPKDYLGSFMREGVVGKGLDGAGGKGGLLSLPPPEVTPGGNGDLTKAQSKSSAMSISKSSSSTSSSTPPLVPASYHKHFLPLLLHELSSLTTLKEQIVLWQKAIQVSEWERAEFILDVPGVREGHPFLEVGDLVWLREVEMIKIEEIIGDGEEKERWVGVGGTGRAVEARVGAIRKREGLVYIKSLPLKEHIWTYVPVTPTTKLDNGWATYGKEDSFHLRFNVSFVTNARPLCLMERAVWGVGDVLGSNLDADADGRLNGSANANGKKKEANGNAVDKAVKDIAKGANLARQWIFPEPEDFMNAPSMKLENGKIEEWIDEGLNDEQKLAVTSVALYQLPVPHLIGGPPGTGKTKTVVEAVLQIFRAQPEACILVCAPSNPATDTLLMRLQKHLKPHEMLRLNDPNRTFGEVRGSIRPYCFQNAENNAFSIPSFKKLMEYRVIVTCCLDASILVNAKCTNRSLMALEEEVTKSLHPHRNAKARSAVQPHWTHLLIDEAAQGSEPELLIPISVVLPKVYDEQTVGRTFMPQLALCGDIHQLGPIITSDVARSGGLEVSLLERLFERKLYARFDQVQREYQTSLGLNQQPKSPYKRKASFASNVQWSSDGDSGAVAGTSGIGRKVSVKGDKGKGREDTQTNGNGTARINGSVSPTLSGNGAPGFQRLPPYTHLVKNYRSHPAILKPPSAIFYNNSLQPCAKNGVISWSGLPNPKLPLKFVGDTSPEESMDERASWFNPGQITKVVEVAKSIMAERDKCVPPLQAKEIGIMAPWREQVWKLREKLREEGLGSVDVGTVEDYQGRESRVVIISCVRSNPRFLDEDHKKSLGVVFERKRMNVAITRAKELLVVIGNAQLLLGSKDPYWKSFLQFAKKRRLYEGPELSGLEVDGNEA